MIIEKIDGERRTDSPIDDALNTLPDMADSAVIDDVQALPYLFCRLGLR